MNITTIIWLSGLALVLTIALITFLLGFLLWTAAWLPVAILPPFLHVLGWVAIIFGLPSTNLLLWAIVLAAPCVSVPQALIKVDNVTGGLSLGKIRLSKAETDLESEKN